MLEVGYELKDYDGAPLVAQSVKCLSAMQETWVRILGREDSLEKETAAHSGILAWRIPWREEPGRLQSVGLQQSDMTERPSTHTRIMMCSILHNPKYTKMKIKF